jgi:hypothetical protein
MLDCHGPGKSPTMSRNVFPYARRTGVAAFMAHKISVANGQCLGATPPTRAPVLCVRDRLPDRRGMDLARGLRRKQRLDQPRTAARLGQPAVAGIRIVDPFRQHTGRRSVAFTVATAVAHAPEVVAVIHTAQTLHGRRTRLQSPGDHRTLSEAPTAPNPLAPRCPAPACSGVCARY